jgi:CheY-like chemotaxis protein
VIHISTKNLHLDHAIQGYQKIPAGDYAVLQIKDEGEGISHKDLQRVFEPFYTKKIMGHSGTGLGMAVVWGTMQDHRGFIDLSSQAGLGTVATLYFPTTHHQQTEQIPDQELDKFRGKGQTILVVDDLESQRDIATRLLTKLGYRVETASSGEMALDRIEKSTFDLVVLDMVMEPDCLDGLDTYQQMIKRHPGQKAIIASGFAETDRIKQAHSLGVGSYVKKPYTIDRIGRAVREQLVAAAHTS